MPRVRGGELLLPSTAAKVPDAAGQAAFANRGIEAVGGSPEASGAEMQSEIRKWTDFVRAKNIRIDQ